MAGVNSIRPDPTVSASFVLRYTRLAKLGSAVPDRFFKSISNSDEMELMKLDTGYEVSNLDYVRLMGNGTAGSRDLASNYNVKILCLFVSLAMKTTAWSRL